MTHTLTPERRKQHLSHRLFERPKSYSPSRQRMPKPLLSGGCENSPRMHPESECRCNAAKTLPRSLLPLPLPRSRLQRNDAARGLLLIFSTTTKSAAQRACLFPPSLSS